MPTCAISWRGTLSSERPSSSIAPHSHVDSRLRQLNNVVFPAPFGPIRPRISPRLTSNETSLSATIAPKRTVTPRMRSSGIADLGKCSGSTFAVTPQVLSFCGPRFDEGGLPCAAVQNYVLQLQAAPKLDERLRRVKEFVDRPALR